MCDGGCERARQWLGEALASAVETGQPEDLRVYFIAGWLMARYELMASRLREAELEIVRLGGMEQ